MKNKIVLISGFLMIIITISGCKTYKTLNDKTNTTIPENCISWFDGCNNCGVVDGKIGGCTKMACETKQEPKCNEFISEKINNPKKNGVSTTTIPEGCVTWFDGCNTCAVNDGKVLGCSEMACETIQEPKCVTLDYVDEYPIKYSK